ncbi:MAG TPA: hypothetical protein VMT17_09990 [Anaeromyxobacteraceae bacterium]|nr:hypothetical protein [Anaeromyxobacteraceae bacterium]
MSRTTWHRAPGWRGGRLLAAVAASLALACGAANAREGEKCPSGQADCGSGCVSLATSANCGGCGVACPTGSTCSSGACQGAPLGVGAHAFKNDVAGLGTNPMTTASLATRTTGSTFVVFAGAGIAGGTAFQSLSDSMGNTYRAIGVPQPYAGGQGELRAFVCSQPCRGGPGHTWSLNKPDALSNWETVLFVVEILGTASLDAFAQADATSSPLAPGAVVTSRAGDLLLVCALAASYGTPDVYTPSAGFALLDDQTNGTNSLGGADAWSLAGPPGTYTGSLASSLATSGAIFLVAFAPP